MCTWATITDALVRRARYRSYDELRQLQSFDKLEQQVGIEYDTYRKGVDSAEVDSEGELSQAAHQLVI